MSLIRLALQLPGLLQYAIIERRQIHRRSADLQTLLSHNLTQIFHNRSAVFSADHHTIVLILRLQNTVNHGLNDVGLDVVIRQIDKLPVLLPLLPVLSYDEFAFLLLLTVYKIKRWIIILLFLHAYAALVEVTFDMFSEGVDAFLDAVTFEIDRNLLLLVDFHSCVYLYFAHTIIPVLSIKC